VGEQVVGVMVEVEVEVDFYKEILT